MKKIFILLVTIIVISGCKRNSDFEINNLDVLSNFELKGDTLNLPVDLTDAVTRGITIPTKRQCDEGYFYFSFRIINKGKKPEEFYYKIFYQNESYKYNEFRLVKSDKQYNELSARNFYGSWENPEQTFHKTTFMPADNNFHLISDSFRITGNPRNESKYFGAGMVSPEISGKSCQK